MSEPVCAVCKKPVPRPERGKLGDFPFCSARCKAVDLSRWLDGDYAIPDDGWSDALAFEPDEQ
ncbi:MAG: DNA gyrase inhibitor YacG [Myxococcales bacterium]|nr:DNA gyrase inhibitor YacG [Myxococcales bacterium]